MRLRGGLPASWAERLEDEGRGALCVWTVRVLFWAGLTGWAGGFLWLLLLRAGP